MKNALVSAFALTAALMPLTAFAAAPPAPVPGIDAATNSLVNKAIVPMDAATNSVVNRAIVPMDYTYECQCLCVEPYPGVSYLTMGTSQQGNPWKVSALGSGDPYPADWVSKTMKVNALNVTKAWDICIAKTGSCSGYAYTKTNKKISGSYSSCKIINNGPRPVAPAVAPLTPGPIPVAPSGGPATLP